MMASLMAGGSNPVSSNKETNIRHYIFQGLDQYRRGLMLSDNESVHVHCTVWRTEREER